jgi:hypothetical protein
MISEAETIIAFLYKRSGKTEQSFSELYLSLSMDLNWFTPEEAKEFVNKSIKQKLLIKTGDLIKPIFEYNKIEVPVGFQPSKKIFKEKKEKKREGTPLEEQDIVTEILHRIINKTKMDEKEFFEKIKRIEQEKNINIEIAALLVGKVYDISLDVFFEKIEERIFKEHREYSR